MPKKRKVHSAEFTAKVAVEAIRGLKTAGELASQYQIHPVQSANIAMEEASAGGMNATFQRSQAPQKVKTAEELTAPLYEKIGRLQKGIPKVHQYF